MLLWVGFLTNLTNRILNLSYGLGFPTAPPGRVPKLSYEEGGRAGGGGEFFNAVGIEFLTAFMSRVPSCFYE